MANDHDVAFAEAGVIALDQVRRTAVRGVVDTGAAMLVSPESVVKRLGLPEAGQVRVPYADQRRAKRKRVRHALVELLGREAVFTAVVGPKRETASIGAIVLEELDLLVDCTKQILHPREPDWIVSEIG